MSDEEAAMHTLPAIQQHVHLPLTNVLLCGMWRSVCPCVQCTCMHALLTHTCVQWHMQPLLLPLSLPSLLLLLLLSLPSLILRLPSLPVPLLLLLLLLQLSVLLNAHLTLLEDSTRERADLVRNAGDIEERHNEIWVPPRAMPHA